MILASEAAVKKHGLTPRAKILGRRRPRCRRASWASARCPASAQADGRLGLKISDFDLIELNEPLPRRASPVCASSASRRRRFRQSDGGAIAIASAWHDGARLA